MPEAHATLFTSEWWFSVFLVGLGIHLIASYLKPRLDQMGGWFSRSWATRNDARAKVRRERIENLKRSNSAKLDATTEEFRSRLKTIQWVVVGVAGLVASNMPLHEPLLLRHPVFVGLLHVSVLFCGTLSLYLGLGYSLRTVRIRGELREAENQRRDEEIKRLEDEIEEAKRLLFDENANPNTTEGGGVDQRL